MIKNIDKEYDRQRIISLLSQKPNSVIKISEELKIPSSTVAKYVTGMENTGFVSLFDFKNNNPRYCLSEGGDGQ